MGNGVDVGMAVVVPVAELDGAEDPVAEAVVVAVAAGEVVLPVGAQLSTPASFW